MRYFVMVLIFLQWWAGPVWAANDHGIPTSAGEQRARDKDAHAPYVESGCNPALDTVLTTSAFACDGYVVMGPTGKKELVFVRQETAAVVTLPAVDGTHWLLLFHDTATSPVDWSPPIFGNTFISSHYRQQQVTAQPADPDGGVVVTRLTVLGGAITQVVNIAKNTPNPNPGPSTVRALDFVGVTADCVADDGPILNYLLATFKYVHLGDPQSTCYATAETLFVATDGTTARNDAGLIGISTQQTQIRIRYIGTAVAAATVVQVGTQGGVGSQGVILKDLTIDGNGLAKWCLEVDDVHQRSTFKNLMMFSCVGLLHADAVWRSYWTYITAISGTGSLPAGMAQVEWDDVHNNVNSAQVAIISANAVVFDTAQFGDCGATTAQIPGGSLRPFQCLFINSGGLHFNNLELNASQGFATDETAADNLIRVGGGGAIHFTNLFLENVQAGRLLSMEDTAKGEVHFQNITSSQIALKESLGFLVRLNGSAHVRFTGQARLSGVTSLGGTSFGAQAFDGTIDTELNVPIFVDHIVYNPVTVLSAGGRHYFDFGTTSLGVHSFSGDKADLDEHARSWWPEILSGLGVATSSPSGDDVIEVEDGMFRFLGKDVPVGEYNATSDQTIGYVLRPTSLATSWNVCVDTSGGIFLEDQSVLKMKIGAGKVILATFDTDASGNISNLLINQHAIRSVHNQREEVDSIKTLADNVQTDLLTITNAVAESMEVSIHCQYSARSGDELTPTVEGGLFVVAFVKDSGGVVTLPSASPHLIGETDTSQAVDTDTLAIEWRLTTAPNGAILSLVINSSGGESGLVHYTCSIFHNGVAGNTFVVNQ